MRLNEIDFSGADPVEGYGPGFFRIAGEVWEGPMRTGRAGTFAWGGYEDTDPIAELAGEVDVLFIGTGAEIAHLPAALKTLCEENGIGVEAMSSPAACRTYNVLLSEGRRVALAVLPV